LILTFLIFWGYKIETFETEEGAERESYFYSFDMGWLNIDGKKDWDAVGIYPVPFHIPFNF